jgi:hypothetical protein
VAPRGVLRRRRLSQLTLGSLLLCRPTRRLLLAGVAGSLALIVLWAYTRIVGVPFGPGGGATEPVGALDVIASVAELATVVCGARAIRFAGVVGSWRWNSWSGPMRSALFATAAIMAVALTAAPRG